MCCCPCGKVVACVRLLVIGRTLPRRMKLLEICLTCWMSMETWISIHYVDFNPLRGFPDGSLTDTTINVERQKMVTAALLHFDGDLATLTRWMGGPHTGEHRNPTQFLARWQPILRDHTYQDLERILTWGSPAHYNASASEQNFQLFLQYGNHACVDADPEKTRKTIVKYSNRGYAILFDPRVVTVAHRVHVTPQGVADIDHPYKEPRPVFDAVFDPSHRRIA